VSVVQVARAIAPEKPVKPKRLIFVLGGVLAGILLAGATAVISILMNKTAVTEDAAERVLGLPVLAVVSARKQTSREAVARQ
jgi:capsular polysaccharide biosynthesis protein